MLRTIMSEAIDIVYSPQRSVGQFFKRYIFQETVETQRSLSKIFFMENRQMPILHKPLAFGEKSLQRSSKVFLSVSLP